jgi:hypothetical protein
MDCVALVPLTFRRLACSQPIATTQKWGLFEPVIWPIRCYTTQQSSNVNLPTTTVSKLTVLQ